MIRGVVPRPTRGASPAKGKIGKGPGVLALNIQAQEWNRCIENFSPNQGPCGPGGNRGAPLKFPRAGRSPPHQRDDPRKWGAGGGGDLEHRNGAPWSRPPGAFLVSFWASKKKLAARRRRNTPRKGKDGAPGRGPGQLLLPLRGNSPSRALQKKDDPGRREGQFPIPFVSLCSTSPLDKGSRPPLQNHRQRRYEKTGRAATWGRPYKNKGTNGKRSGTSGRPSPTRA